MKILFCQWNSICEKDAEDAFRKLNVFVDVLYRKMTDVDYDLEYVNLLSGRLLEHQYDGVFTINFIPVISRVCQIHHIKYLSWVVDSPLVQLYSDTIHNLCNYIFIFDKALYRRFVKENQNHIFYMPLGANVELWDTVRIGEEDVKNFSSDISFVGSLYSEKCNYNRLNPLPPYLEGYFDALLQAQVMIYGHNFLADLVTGPVAALFRRENDWIPFGRDYREDESAIIADEYLGTKCTEMERVAVLRQLSSRYQVDLYTNSDSSMIPGVHNKGPADSRRDMPKIFKLSKINLHMTAKTIQSGLSLRVYDILANQGFLISNYQPEIEEYFEIGRDIVVYDSIEDLMEKVDYYLKHEEERKQIAQNGYQKVKAYYKYQDRLADLLYLAFKTRKSPYHTVPDREERRYDRRNNETISLQQGSDL